MSLDRYWCPAALNGQDGREAQASVGPDYIGVYVQTRHNFITGLFGPGRTRGRASSCASSRNGQSVRRTLRRAQGPGDPPATAAPLTELVLIVPSSP